MPFNDIKGQDNTIDIIKRSMSSVGSCGSYLFLGPEGIGKYFSAKILAKAVNCLNKEMDACEECASCLKINKLQHPDIFLLGEEDSSEIKIDEIRSMQKEISLRPYEARRKVFIINNAHKLTAEASNALLKTLEEPPKHSLIILVTHLPNLLFKTIVSRCKPVKFHLLSQRDLAVMLVDDFNLENSQAHFLSYFAEGRIGKALRLKDTDIVAKKNVIIDEFTSNNKNTGIIQGKEDLRQGLDILAGWFRDIYMVKVGMPYDYLINIDRKAELLSGVDNYSFSDLDEIMGNISNSLLYLQQNINSKLLVSNLKLSLASPSAEFRTEVRHRPIQIRPGVS